MSSGDSDETPTVLKTSEFAPSLAQKLQQLRGENALIDCKIRVQTADGNSKEFSAHKVVLAAGSNYFEDTFKSKSKREGVTEVTLKLRTESAAACFEVLLDFLYTGVLNIGNNSLSQLMQVARNYQISEAESLLQPYCKPPSPPPAPSLPALPFSTALFPPASATLDALLNGNALQNSSLVHNAMEMQLQLAQFAAQRLSQQPFLNSQLFSSVLPQFPSFNFASTSSSLFNGQSVSPERTPPRKRKKPLSQGSDDSETGLAIPDSNEGSMEDSPDPLDNMGEIIVPSSDREGWCRNKKYIERVPNGFMCTVCRKVYGRYNSVSYHVTIYHRNPPIKCDEEGCQFSTREARYIHFHKFYRHKIPLPDSIDLGSRKCPFCRHISKSPAMLEKHISRHLADCTRTGTPLKCPQCETDMDSHKAMLEHMLTHQDQEQEMEQESGHSQKRQKNTRPEPEQQEQEPDAGFPCDHCSYRGQSEVSLRHHVMFKHNAAMFSRKLSCELCQYACAEAANLKAHIERMHPESRRHSQEREVGPHSPAAKSGAQSPTSDIQIPADCSVPLTVP